MQKIIVDGYNVIHADGALKRDAARGMEWARNALVARIRAYLKVKNVQVTLVFDGAGGMVDAEAVVPGRLQVLYSASGQSADDVIVETLHAHANPREFIVVTNDMADIGRSVRAIGATLMASLEFLARLESSAAPDSSETAHEKPDPSGEDVDYWLRQFGKTGERDD